MWYSRKPIKSARKNYAQAASVRVSTAQCLNEAMAVNFGCQEEDSRRIKLPVSRNCGILALDKNEKPSIAKAKVRIVVIARTALRAMPTDRL